MKIIQQQTAILGVLIALGTMTAPVEAQRTSPTKKKGISVGPTLSPVPSDFSDGLNRVRTLTTERRFALAIMELNALSMRAKEMQRQSIQSAVPNTPSGYVKESPSADDADAPYVVFSQSYSCTENTEVELIVTMADPSIDEYRQMIQSPASVSYMEDTKIIEVKSGFPALEKYSSSDGIYERHIILGDNLMIAVTGHGITDRSRIDAFCDAIDLRRIQSELKQ